MSDAGYTLTETLAALAILGLAISGLATGVAALGRGQSMLGGALSEARAVRAAQSLLDQTLGHEGPFRAHEPAAFSGDETGFRFTCGEPQPCSASLQGSSSGVALIVRRGVGERRLLLRGLTSGRVVYEGRRGMSGVWPPADVGRDTLRTVIVMTGPAGREEVLIASRVWREQPVACEFDVLMQDCR